jgi:hypothetical protein
MITVRLLFDDYKFYSVIKYIVLDQSLEINQYIFNEIIWIHEHYEFIEQLREIEPDIKLLLEDSNNIGWISKIQYKLAKKFLKLFQVFLNHIKFFH